MKLMFTIIPSALPSWVSVKYEHGNNIYLIPNKGSTKITGLDHKEDGTPKNWCCWFVRLEKTLETLLDSKEIKPVNPKGDQPWIFIGRTDAEAEALILWPPDGKNWLIGKDPNDGKDGGQEEKGVTEDEMVGWYHWLNGHEFEKTLGVSEKQGSLVCCSP